MTAVEIWCCSTHHMERLLLCPEEPEELSYRFLSFFPPSPPPLMSLGGHKQGALAGVQAGELVGRDGLTAGMGAAWWSSACPCTDVRTCISLFHSNRKNNHPGDIYPSFQFICCWSVLSTVIRKRGGVPDSMITYTLVL